MATTNNYENMTQCKTCRCGEADTNIWTTKTSDNPDKQIQKCSNCQVLKSGTLFLSSKGIGWTSWKKRWFILTRTSLVFYRSDPNAAPQKGNEANLTLGGIDLNNSGSVVVKADKKLITVFFPDGRDGRTFTLKAETSEDLHEWRTALESALAQAPSPALAIGQNGILRNDVADPVEASVEQWKDRRPEKSLVVGRPILLALEDIDGSPSFLEKALRFIEDHGIKVEGILRQSADVEEVERRVREYEQGKVEFSSDEDAHVVGDCIKHILRELPSSPVPATSCTALVEAYRTDRGSRISAMRAAITETFPEPNRRLVQRILKMMRTIASNKSVNRMTLSAVAACMAPLLLRPLLAGDCELEDDFNMGGDGSLQLLQAAAAANHAQAIVIILLEEYERIFDEDVLEEASVASDLYSESEDGGVEDEHSTDNGSLDDDGFSDPDNGLVDDSECSSSRTLSESNSDAGDDLYENKDSDEQSSVLSSPRDNENAEATKTLRNTDETTVVQEKSTDASFLRHVATHKDDISQSENSKAECVNRSNDPLPNIKQPTVLGRTAARKNLSMEAIDFSGEDEIAILKLEMTKDDLQTKISNEVKGNEILHASLEKRKEDLHKRRLALEQDVERLQEQLQKEIDMRVCLEAGLKNLEPGQLPIPSSMDSKTRENLEEISLAEADINNLKQKATDLHGQLSHQKQHNYAFLCESCSQQLYMMYKSERMKPQEDVDGTTIVHKKERLTKQEQDPLSEFAVENLQAKSHDSPSSLNREPSRNQQLKSQAQNNTVCSGFDDSQNTVLSTATIDPQKNSANNENAPLRAVDEDVSKQIVDSHSSPKNRFHDAAPKKSSSRKENSMLGTEFENVKNQTEDSPSPPDKLLTQKLQPNRTNQRSTKYEESINVLSMGPTMSGNDTFTKMSSPRSVTVKKKHSFNKSKITDGTSSASGDEITPMVRDAASPISRDENSMHGAGCEYSKTQSQESPSSPDSHSPQKSQSKTTKQSSKSTEEPTTSPDAASNKFSFSNETFEIEQSFQNSMASRGFTSVSVEEPKTVGHGGALKKSTSKGETQTQDSLSSHKLQRNAVSQSGNRFIGLSFTPSAEEPIVLGRSTASKKSSFRGETVKMESQDSPSLTNRQQPSRKQQSNITHLNSMKSLGHGNLSSSDELTISRNATYRRSSTRGEETPPSTSSALAKLTSRLNFLKERRVQLVNELQNLDAGRAIGSEGLPPRNDSR